MDYYIAITFKTSTYLSCWISYRNQVNNIYFGCIQLQVQFQKEQVETDWGKIFNFNLWLLHTYTRVHL